MRDRPSEVHELQPPGELSNRELWAWRVQRTPQRRWLWEDGSWWTYAAFDEEVRSLAAGLRELGVEQGTRVLVGLSTRREAVQAHLAIQLLGGVVVPLVAGTPVEELRFPIAHSDARLMIADQPIASQIGELREPAGNLQTLIVLDTDSDSDSDADTGHYQVERFREVADAAPLPHGTAGDGGDSLQEPSLIVYTSGSTGRPKGVGLKTGCYYHCGLGYADLYGFHGDDNYFNPLTFGHSLASVAGLGIPIVTGGAISLVERFRPSLFWKQVRDSQATISVLFPAHLNLLVAADDGSVRTSSSSLRLIVTHADVPDFRERYGIPLGMIWGTTETLVCAGSDPGYAGELGPGYVGRPFAGGEVGVFDEHFNRLGPYRHGELCMRHPQVMIGYLNDPEATAQALRDGWIRSADRGYVDHSGRVFFSGRYKTMIKRSGENVSAEEVEQALLASGDVSECAVVAVPDRLRTEEVGAVVVAKAVIDPAQLRQACGVRLSRWKLPRFILVREEPLPRLANGKIDRLSTSELIDPGTAWDADAAAWDADADEGGA